MEGVGAGWKADAGQRSIFDLWGLAMVLKKFLVLRIIISSSEKWAPKGTGMRTGWLIGYIYYKTSLP